MNAADVRNIVALAARLADVGPGTPAARDGYAEAARLGIVDELADYLRETGKAELAEARALEHYRTRRRLRIVAGGAA